MPSHTKPPKLYVGNISFQATESDLLALFGGYGARRVTVVTDKATARPRGFAFVEFDSRECAEQAMRATDGVQHMGRTVIVSEAVEKQR